MPDDDHARRSSVFGGYAEEYERARPGYPDAAVDWLLPPGAGRVVDLGAGTGKLTGSLLTRGLEVVAVEPDAAMLAVLTQVHWTAEAHRAGADALPLPDASVDAVLVGQAWHWFPHEAAAAEVRRVLRPGGQLGLAWNTPVLLSADVVEPWERELAALDPDPRAEEDDEGPLEVEGLPTAELQQTVVPWSWQVGPAGVRAVLATHSRVALMPAPERDRLLDAAEAVVAAETARRGTATVPWHREAFCVRWRPGGW